MHSDRRSPDGRGMKEGAPAGKRLNPSPCFSSAKKKRDRRKVGHPRQKPRPYPSNNYCLVLPRDSPSRPGRDRFPDPAGRRCAGPIGGCSLMAWSFTSAVAANPYVFCALFLRRKSGGEEEGLIRPFGRRAAPPRRVLSISMES